MKKSQKVSPISVGNPNTEMVKKATETEFNLTCELCNKWFNFIAPDKASLEEHYALIHYEEAAENKEKQENVKYDPDLCCKLCNNWFTYIAPNKAVLKNHYAMVHKVKNISRGC